MIHNSCELQFMPLEKNLSLLNGIRNSTSCYRIALFWQILIKDCHVRQVILNESFTFSIWLLANSMAVNITAKKWTSTKFKIHDEALEKQTSSTFVEEVVSSYSPPTPSFP